MMDVDKSVNVYYKFISFELKFRAEHHHIDQFDRF